MKTIFLIFGLSFLISYSFWTYLKFEILEKVEEITQRTVQAGYRLSFSDLNVFGFPLTFRVEFNDLKIEEAGTHNWGWGSEKLVVLTSLWSLNKLAFQSDGVQKFYPKKGSKPWILGAKSGFVSGQINLKNDRISDLTFTGKDIEISDSTRLIAFYIKDLGLRLFSLLSPSPGINLEILDLKLPRDIGLPIEPKVESMYFEAKVKGALPSRVGSEEFARWRDEGGIIEVLALNFESNKLKFRSKGTLALGNEFQPLGAFSARISNTEEMLEFLEQKELIESRDMLMVRLMFAGLSQTFLNENTQKLELPITLQDDTIYLGPFRIFHINKIKWFDKILG